MCLPSYLLSKYVPWMFHPPSRISHSLCSEYSPFHNFSFLLKSNFLLLSKLFFLAVSLPVLFVKDSICWQGQWMLWSYRVSPPSEATLSITLPNTERASEDVQRLPKFVWHRTGQQSNLNSIKWPWRYPKNASDSACVCDIKKVLTQGKRS